MKTLQKGDFVVAIKDVDDIVRRSVGLITEVLDGNVTVFFIGKRKTVTTDSKNVEFIDVNKIGEKKEVKKKICNICHQIKEVDEFEINQTDAEGRKTTRPSCRECRVVINGTPMSTLENKRMNRIKPKGVFTCPICGKTSIVDVTVNIVADHDHYTGKGREWICDSCNTGLGRFKDDTEILQKAIDYLKRYS